MSENKNKSTVDAAPSPLAFEEYPDTKPMQFMCEAEAKQDDFDGPAFGTTVVSAHAGLSTIGDSAQVLNVSKIEKTSEHAEASLSQKASCMQTYGGKTEDLSGQIKKIQIDQDDHMIVRADSRSVTPLADVRKSGSGHTQLLHNGGDIDVMEFKINEVTNNPVPTDIFTFKKLSNQYSRVGTSMRKQKNGNRMIISQRRDSQGGSLNQSSRRGKSRSKYKRGQSNNRMNKILQFEGGDSMEGGSYTEGNRQMANTHTTNSQLIDMTQQIVKSGQPNPAGNYTSKGTNQAAAMQTTMRQMEGSNSPTLDQSQLSDPMQIAKAHAKNGSFINAQEDSFIQAKSPSHGTQQFYNDTTGANTFHAKKFSNSSNNIIGQKMKTIPRKKSTGQTIEDANSKKIRELKETYHKIAQIQSNTYNNRNNAKQNSLFGVNSNQGSSTNSVANRLQRNRVQQHQNSSPNVSAYAQRGILQGNKGIASSTNRLMFLGADRQNQQNKSLNARQAGQNTLINDGDSYNQVASNELLASENTRRQMMHQSHAILSGTYQQDQNILINTGNNHTGSTVEQQDMVGRVGGGPPLGNMQQFNRMQRRSVSNPKQSNKGKRYSSANPSKKIGAAYDVRDQNRQLNEASSKNINILQQPNNRKGRRQNSQLSNNEKLSQTNTKSQTLSIYNQFNHSQPSGYYYNQDAAKTPPFYNRTGPGLYFQNNDPWKPLDNKLSIMSQKDNIHGQKMGQQDMPTGIYVNSLPAHRFVDYSKSQLNYKMQQSKQIANQINTNLHAYMNEVPASEKNTEKRLDILFPNFDQAEKNQKNGQSFKKEKRPELFPVKDEHKNPCSYLKKNHSALNQRNVALNKILREFQEDPPYKSPGPLAYKPDTDPGKKLDTGSKPLTGKKSFIEHNKSTIPTGKRESAFGNNFKVFLGDRGFEKTHHNAGTRLGPGPGGINLRNINDGLASFHHKKTSSVKTTMNCEQRHIGQPNPSVKYPGPGFYEHKGNQMTLQNSSVLRGQQAFQKSKRIIDIIKFKEGNEEFIIKGLH